MKSKILKIVICQIDILENINTQIYQLSCKIDNEISNFEKYQAFILPKYKYCENLIERGVSHSYKCHNCYYTY